MECHLWLVDAEGAYQRCTAIIENYSECGLGLLSTASVSSGQDVMVEGVPSSVAGSNGRLKATVTWCGEIAAGQYRIGLTVEPAAVETGPDDGIDYYEILQIHPKAEAETIQRVYRILAQRYHPDNGETGNSEMFQILVRAYRVLSDIELRAGYDVRRNRNLNRQARVFDTAGAASQGEIEKRKRAAILSALYDKRVQQPGHPGMPIQEMEDLVAVPREHLEFSLWYLRENGMVTRTDNGRYIVTVKGVDQAEAVQTDATPPAVRLLGSSQSAA